MWNDQLTMLCVLAANAITLGCGPHPDIQCGANSDCDLYFGGSCTTAPSGHPWCSYPDPSCPGGMRYSDQQVGDGVSGRCVGVTGDAGVGDVDVPPIDIVNNYQAANLVLCQENFSTNDSDHGGTSAQSCYFPDSVAIDSATGILWLNDANNGRVRNDCSWAVGFHEHEHGYGAVGLEVSHSCVD